MKFDWKFFKTTKGIITLCALFFFFFAVTAVILVAGITQQLASSDVETPPLPVQDFVDLMVDPKKAEHMVNAELAVINALNLGRKKKNYEKLHAYMKEAVDESTDALGETSQITCYLVDMQAAFELDFDKWTEAEKLERRLLKLTPENDQYSVIRCLARMNLARALTSQAKMPEAMAIYLDNLKVAEETDLRKHSKSMSLTKRALDMLAQCYEANRNYDEACSIQEKLFALAQRQSESLVSLSNILCHEARLRRYQRRFDESAKLLEKAFALGARDSYLYVSRARLSEEMGNYKAALKDLNMAMTIDPQITWYRESRIRVEKAMGDYKSALADAQEIIILSSESADGYNLRAELRGYSGQDLLALSDYDMAVKLDKYNPATFLNRGALQEKLGRHQQAIADDDLALSLNLNTNLNNTLNKAFYLDDDIKVDCGKEKMPLTILALQNRATAYRALKQKAKADQDLEKAIKLEADWRKYLATK